MPVIKVVIEMVLCNLLVCMQLYNTHRQAPTGLGRITPAVYAA